MPLAYCTNHEHHIIEREALKQQPGSRKKAPGAVEDPSVYCFVNKDGKHVTPRRCTCSKYRPAAEDRAVDRWKTHELFHVAAQELVKMPNGGGYIETVIPPKAFKALMMAIYSKLDPNCPIEDPHNPIDNNTAF